MIETITDYENQGGETLKNLVNKESVIINHVVMEPGQSFPAHVTEHEVHIIIVKGAISISLDKQDSHEYSAGKMVSLPKGVVSGLSNPSKTKTELFVVKSIADNS
ncbi:MAG: cupin domain-containing protein [Clostridia bacterium]|nr:cupin domain-containing protein [Clostridia bacterium]